MAKPIHIGKQVALVDLLKYAEEVVTEEGRRYYRFPRWFELLPEDSEFVIHQDDSVPEDLKMFITFHGLGGHHKRITKPKV